MIRKYIVCATIAILAYFLMAETQLSVQPCTLKSWVTSWTSDWFSWMKWNAYNEEMLRTAEKILLGLLKTPYRGHYVEMRGVVDSKDKIWTISLNEESKKTPLVMLHGLASGSALWCLNLDSLAANRPVHALDVLGFGRSSRPDFSPEAREASNQMVESIEAWRREMKLDKIIMLGHSFGGYLAAAYSIQYPDRVQHLILADSWGFPNQPDESEPRKIPFWAKPVLYIAKKNYPLTPLRATGPFGQWMVQKLRPDLVRHYEPFLKQDSTMIPQYIHQCNIQKPSGEMAFTAMSSSFVWAKEPMIERISELKGDVPLTVLNGGRSWIGGSTSDEIRSKRPPNSFLNYAIIQGAGHHLYAEKYETFNKLVNDAASTSETN